MSDSKAIAAVTAALQALLHKRLAVSTTDDPSADQDLQGTLVTFRPPDEAKAMTDALQLNLFLFQTSLDAAWRNTAPGNPPLPLTLHYLLTPYVRHTDQDSKYLAHRLLGRAMSILHDHPVLGAQELKDALPGSDAHQQIERVRIVPESLSTEEISKLWATFQTPYRTSAAYQVSVVLVTANRASPVAAPVLKRGPDDQGVLTATGPAPSVVSALPPPPQPALRLGEPLLLSGTGLSGTGLSARAEGRLLAAPVALDLTPGPEGKLTALVKAPPADPDAASRWAPGFYTLTIVVNRPGLPAWTTNAVPFALAPVITLSTLSGAPGDLSLTVFATPRLRDGQTATLLFGDRQAAPKTVTNPGDAKKPTELAFEVKGLAAGTYLARLRVDGVDSLPFIRKPGPPETLEFDPGQQVVIS